MGREEGRQQGAEGREEGVTRVREEKGSKGLEGREKRELPDISLGRLEARWPDSRGFWWVL